MSKQYDLLIIGGGPGGYVASVRAAQLGLKVAILEKNKIGGVCLHSGCIPSKTLIRSSEVYKLMKNSNQYGVFCSDIKFKMKDIQNRVSEVKNTLYKGIESLLNSYNIDIYNGHGSLMPASIFSPLPGGSVSVSTEKGDSEIIVPKNIILAVGSFTRTLKGLDIDNEFIISSDEALKMQELPESIIIIGGGIIGIEWACLLNNFGVKVTIIEYAKNILSNEDIDISIELKKHLIKQGISIVTEAEIIADTISKNKDIINIQAKIGAEYKEFQANKIMVAVGRMPNTKNLGLENTSVSLTKEGYIEVDDNFKTKENHIFAIGDVNGFMQLAHSASAQGIYVVEYIKNLNPVKIIKSNIPRCVYSNPEIASLGLSEKEAKDCGFEIKVFKFPMQYNSKALVYGDVSGFVKIITDKKTDDLLGIHIIGLDATNLISEAALAKFLDATSLEIGKTIHPHPTLSESIMEAALGIEKQSIHKH